MGTPQRGFAAILASQVFPELVGSSRQTPACPQDLQVGPHKTPLFVGPPHVENREVHVPYTLLPQASME